MRTTIVLDEDLVEQARQLTGIKTKKELIHEALRVMIRLRQQSQVRSLRAAPIQDDALAALADLLTRESLLAGEDTPAPIWVESAALRQNWKDLSGGRSVHALPPGREALSAFLGD